MGINMVCTVPGCTVGKLCTVSSPSTGSPGTAGTACGSTGGGRLGDEVCTVREDCCTGVDTGDSDGILGGNLNVGDGRIGGGFCGREIWGLGMLRRGIMSINVKDFEGKLNT